MAKEYKVTLLKIGNSYVNPDRKDFLLETGTDEEINEQIAGLPTTTKEGTLPGMRGKCSAGSVAYTPDLKVIYMLGSDDVWYNANEEN